MPLTSRRWDPTQKYRPFQAAQLQNTRDTTRNVTKKKKIAEQLTLEKNEILTIAGHIGFLLRAGEGGGAGTTPSPFRL